MATIQERKTKSGKISYTAIVRLKGYPTQTATFDKKSEAKEWVQELEVSIKLGKLTKTKDLNKHTLSELIDRYIKYELPQRKSDHIKFARQLAWWKKNMGAYYLSDITPSLLSEYRDKLQSENNKANATVNRYLAALSVVFSIAAREWEWVEQNPVLKVRKRKEPRGRVRFLTDEEKESLLEACKKSSNPYLYPVVILAIASGARSSEILNLTWDKIDFRRKLIYLLDTKNGESRSVPISSKIESLLTQLKSNNTNSRYLFPSTKGDSPRFIRKAWCNAAEEAGLEDFRFHDLRHTAASYLAMNGATLMELRHILGHKTLQMVKRYAHLTDQHTADLVERMNQNTLQI